MPNYYNDGNVYFGSVVATINGTPYVADQNNFEQSATSIIRRSEINVPNGAVHIKDLIKFTATLQLASSSTPIPDLFDVAAITYRGASKNFIVSKVGQPMKQDEIRKIEVEMTEKLSNVGGPG